MAAAAKILLQITSSVSEAAFFSGSPRGPLVVVRSSSRLARPNSNPGPSPRYPSSLIRTHPPLLSSATSLRPFSRSRNSPPAIMLHESPVVSDVLATAISGGIALSLLRVFEETAKRGLFDQKLNRKLVHISIGLVFMLCWPMFSSGHRGAILASLVPGVNIFRVLLVGLDIWKHESTVKSMSRFGDSRELLKGPLYYATTMTLACAVYWRSSPIAIAAVSNLCAGDGLADIVGRRYGHHKIPYNRNKSFAGSVAMAIAGFLASLGYLHYFASFGYIQESWELAWGFLIVSVASTVVESLPWSTQLDDNLTVPLTCFLLGRLVF